MPVGVSCGIYLTSHRLGQDSDKHTYLARFPPALIINIFKKGVEEYLGCVLLAINAGWQGGIEDLDAVAGWLVTLPQTFRFELAVGFLSDSEKNAATSLFERYALYS